MRRLSFAVTVGIVAILCSIPVATAENEKEWVDLMSNDLKDWTRTGVGKNPWRLTGDRTLICGAEADGYTPDWEFKDGTVKFEYRFVPTREKTGYKASLLIRRTDSFAGCKLSLGDDCGTLSGTFSAGSDSEKTLEIPPTVKCGRPAGEWNKVEIRMEGKSVFVKINDKEVGSWNRCPTNHGLVIFESEGSEIEFRRIYWKEVRTNE